ncbi:MAG: hypothetical protein EBR82_71260 [Caulobacteraceae bacterium]|nr:hypothetical protein [Caulobacteraceae bacterium]
MELMVHQERVGLMDYPIHFSIIKQKHHQQRETLAADILFGITQLNQHQQKSTLVILIIIPIMLMYFYPN